MTIQQIEYFFSCASLLSFSTTAKVHYTSQSTVTRQISSLESELGVKLFIRNTHKVSVTNEGMLFFLLAQSILAEMVRFNENLISKGMLPPKKTQAFRIATYTSDGMYRKLVNLIQAFPPDWLNKPYMFIFPKAGKMVNAVMDGSALIGIDSAVHLKKFGSTFETRLLHRSPFRLLVGKKHPLYGRESIETELLLRDFNKYGDYIPVGKIGKMQDEKKIENSEDLRRLGEFTIELIPQIDALLVTSAPLTLSKDNIMIIVSRDLELINTADLWSVRLKDKSITTDYVVFWKKGLNDIDLNRFLELL